MLNSDVPSVPTKDEDKSKPELEPGSVKANERSPLLPLPGWSSEVEPDPSSKKRLSPAGRGARLSPGMGIVTSEPIELRSFDARRSDVGKAPKRRRPSVFSL